jgi:hypothetical protein
VVNERLLWIAAGVAAVVFAVKVIVPAVWWAIGQRRLRQAGPAPLHAATQRIWVDPGSVGALDPVNGPGPADGAPQPPFQFLEEHTTGSQPTVSVRDACGRVWRVKWGQEVRCETFAVRFAWSCGYFAEETHFVAAGTIEGATTLGRARACIDERDGTFREARFELDDPAVTKMFEEHSWAWDDNPFLGTRELNGLKLVVMLLSNWDTKDRRDVARGSNTAIFEHRLADGRREARYLLTDWGGSMGRWGTNAATRGRWDAAGFAEQTSGFVTGVTEDGCVMFGYAGQRTADVAHGIPLEHVRWFSRFLEPLTTDYLARALRASGASADDTPRFAAALRDRIDQLVAVGRAETVEPVQDRIA